VFDLSKLTTGTLAYDSTYHYDKLTLYPDYYCSQTPNAPDPITTAQDYYVGVVNFAGAPYSYYANGSSSRYGTFNLIDGFYSSTKVTDYGLSGTYAVSNPGATVVTGSFESLNGGSYDNSYVSVDYPIAPAALGAASYSTVYVNINTPYTTSINFGQWTGIALNLWVNPEWASETQATASNPIVAVKIGEKNSAGCVAEIVADVPINFPTTHLYELPTSNFSTLLNPNNCASTTLTDYTGGTIQYVTIEAASGTAAITANGWTTNTNNVAAGAGSDGVIHTIINVQGAITLYYSYF
jgi:hypothetical protein